ncbi:SPOR domain-containing protein [Deinococcus petrolearius]|uniref:SPOR domain-containing protein n=1 Tax=Deinococcus petrolearius TaxID=1751295 RepID=A0ABW1DGF1_9DEIO
MTRLKARSGGPRRWPDVMIGVLVLALLGGFGALLLEQRPRSVAQAPAEAPATVVIPASPGTVSEVPTPQTPSQSDRAAQPVPQAPATAASGAQAPAPQTLPVQTPPAQPSAARSPEAQRAQTPASQGARTAEQPQGSGTAPTTTPAPSTSVQATPAPPATSAPAPPQAAAPQTAAATEIPPVPAPPPVGPLTTLPLPENAAPVPAPTPTPASPQVPANPQAPAGTGASPRAGGAVAASAARTPLRSDYRISLGSFGSEGAARSRTAGVSGLGYTVYPIDIGSGYVAQVGPFADEATARQALADIQRAYPGALLYRPRERAAQTEADRVSAPAADSGSDTPAQTAPDPQSAAAQTAPGQETATPAAQAPAPSGPRYLQVGAFDREESAQRLVGMLRDAGFAPTVSAPPEGKVTVLVGPYSGDALLSAEGRLDNAGMDHFRVR